MSCVLWWQYITLMAITLMAGTLMAVTPISNGSNSDSCSESPRPGPSGICQPSRRIRLPSRYRNSSDSDPDPEDYSFLWCGLCQAREPEGCTPQNQSSGLTAIHVGNGSTPFVPSDKIVSHTDTYVRMPLRVHSDLQSQLIDRNVSKSATSGRQIARYIEK